VETAEKKQIFQAASGEPGPLIFLKEKSPFKVN